jgi:hypothetical protein
MKTDCRPYFGQMLLRHAQAAAPGQACIATRSAFLADSRFSWLDAKHVIQWPFPRPVRRQVRPGFAYEAAPF